MMCRVLYPSPLGPIALNFANDSLTELKFQCEQSPSLSECRAQVFPAETSLNHSFPVLDAVLSWLNRYFQGQNPDVSALPLNPRGSAFALMVWSELEQIPYGTTLSYGQLAVRIARRCGRERMSSQAVGQALKKNPLLLVIPCHRIICSDGSLGGFSAGLKRKRFLLHLESATTKKLNKSSD